MNNTANRLASIAQANQKSKVKDPMIAFQKKVRWGSHQYVRHVVKRAEKEAELGYGSVRITIDKTTDLFQTDEGRNSCYDSSFVCGLLSQQGFKFNNGEYADHYDAFSTELVWDKNLPTSPNKIGMSWE